MRNQSRGALHYQVVHGKQSRVYGAAICLMALGAACGGGSNEGDDDQTVGTGGSASGSTSGGGTGGFVLASGGTGDVGGAAGAGASAACAETHAETTLRPVRLAFLFDVSGSMGKLDFAWHDPTLKWEPVVAATRSFFAEPASSGLEASLTFFPASADKCDAATYESPDVPFTALPSSDFGDAITAVTPASSDDWRGGTPTLAALTGTLETLAALAAEAPDITYAIVLVTDGYPQGCDDNSIASVTEVVSAAQSTIRTYVIGVENPPLDGAPDTVSDLDAIAVAGGTDAAYFIDTGDPAATTASLLGVINGIRGQTLSCELEIPPPPAGRELDAQRVKVTYTTGGNATDLAYDPECAAPQAWHYDDPAAPTLIHLCPDTCAAVQADPTAELSVAFACEVVIPVLY